MALTRRLLLTAAARIGGAGAVADALTIWDFLKPPPAQAAGLELPPTSGRGKRVVILGAGVAGLCAAYELDCAGYDCVVLEASDRAGGRSLTIRRGDTIEEEGFARQTCAFDEGQYFNAGPGRVPHHHVRFIDYCRKFGVALQPYIFASRSNLVHSGYLGNGRTLQVRQAYYDLQGQVAELLDKCMARPDAELPVTKDQLESFREMIARFGDLTKIEEGGATRYVYRNRWGRAGYEEPPGLPNEPGKPLSPMRLDEILKSKVWDDYIFRDAEFFWQSTLLEAVGGMDNFYKAFLRQPLARGSGTIADLIRYGRPVDAIDVAGDGVTVSYPRGGGREGVTAEYCISTIPVPIFRRLQTNLPADYLDAAEKMPIHAAGKVAWQAERFWETQDQIYGGISWTTDIITQIWYPSSDFLSARGTLTGAYMYGAPAERFNAMSVADRLRTAREQGERLHAGYADKVKHGLAIGWNNMRFARMGWTDEAHESFGEQAQKLAAPQGRFHMAGCQLTYWSGWQEGALISALQAVKSIDRQTRPSGGG